MILALKKLTVQKGKQIILTNNYNLVCTARYSSLYLGRFKRDIKERVTLEQSFKG